MTMKEIYLAGGCFWGTQAYLRQLPGITDTEVGYGNATSDHPTYQEVCAGGTHGVECVRVIYDPAVIGLDLLLQAFFRTIDPTTLNRQGNDRGEQYRSGIYWVDPADQSTVLAALEQLQNQTPAPVVVEAQPLDSFWAAEDWHQDYLQKNPFGYCHVNLGDAQKFIEEHRSEFGPGAFAEGATTTRDAIEAQGYAAPGAEVLRKRLSPLAFAVTQEAATEPAWTSDLGDQFQPGIYVDATSGEPLFSSSDKFQSGCGWPAFSRPIDPSVVTEHGDDSLPFMPRTEVRSRAGGAHLGHVFNDGPASRGGLRYCINGAALRFIPKNQMEAEGYDYLLPLVKID